MRYLAIDLGERRTGLAVGDDQTKICSPIEVIETVHPSMRLNRLTQVIEEHAPDELVLGLPLNMDDTEGPAAKNARRFATELTDGFGLKVHLVDERLTSEAANQQLTEQGLTRGQKKSKRDALAAAEILRRFLEQVNADKQAYNP